MTMPLGPADVPTSSSAVRRCALPKCVGARCSRNADAEMARQDKAVSHREYNQLQLRIPVAVNTGTTASKNICAGPGTQT